MFILYKLFLALRTVFFGSFLLATLICVNVSGVMAQSELYTVTDVEADVTAANALEARNQAFEQAQNKAFSILAKRMLSQDELEDFEMPTGLALSSLIKDYEVENEKLSARRYSANYTIRFQDEAIRTFFSNRGLSYSDVASKPILVLPFMQTGRGTVLWSESNEWLQAWNEARGLDGLVPLIVPIGDLDDVKDIGDEEALTYNWRNLASMVRRYSASEAVILIANKVPGRSVGEERLEVQIYRTDNRPAPEYVQQVFQDFVKPSLDEKDEEAANILMQERTLDTYDMAVKKVMDALRQDWKDRTALASAERASADGVVKVRVQFQSLQQWAEIRRDLERVSGLDDVEIAGLSQREAYLNLYFPGGFERLLLALQQIDMRLLVGVNSPSSPEYMGGQSAQGGLYGYQNYSQGADDDIYELVYERGASNSFKNMQAIKDRSYYQRF